MSRQKKLDKMDVIELAQEKPKPEMNPDAVISYSGINDIKMLPLQPCIIILVIIILVSAAYTAYRIVILLPVLIKVLLLQKSVILKSILKSLKILVFHW